MTKALYQQVANSILEQIQSGELQPGARLPSENALSEQHQVGRNTIRHALSELTVKGYVESVQGVGTFVTETLFPKTVEFLYGFSQEMAQRGKNVGSKVIEAKIIQADPLLARVLRIQLGAEVVFLNRLRIVDGKPAAIERAYLPHTFCLGILEHDFSQESLYDVLAVQYNMKPDHAEQEIGAEIATPQVAALMELSHPAAVLVIHRETRTAEGRVIEYVESEFRSDRFRFYTNLKASASSPTAIFQRFPIKSEEE
ncbi:MAG TPA: GntR family transcriptional regulator [Chloroflexi bacterium]|nr:GntR family transcriptional regulator [Chloroflexota bacterium]